MQNINFPTPISSGVSALGLKPPLFEDDDVKESASILGELWNGYNEWLEKTNMVYFIDINTHEIVWIEK